MVKADPSLAGMGTTLTALLWSGSQLGLVHIGDSRAYLVRDGEVFQITHDHTLVQSLLDEGKLTAEEAASHPQQQLLLRALGAATPSPISSSGRPVRATATCCVPTACTTRRRRSPSSGCCGR